MRKNCKQKGMSVRRRKISLEDRVKCLYCEKEIEPSFAQVVVFYQQFAIREMYFSFSLSHSPSYNLCFICGKHFFWQPAISIVPGIAALLWDPPKTIRKWHRLLYFRGGWFPLPLVCYEYFFVYIYWTLFGICTSSLMCAYCWLLMLINHAYHSNTKRWPTPENSVKWKYTFTHLCEDVCCRYRQWRIGHF